MNAPRPRWPTIATPAQHFIGNRWQAPDGGAELPMVDPSDGATFAAMASSATISARCSRRLT